MLRTPSRFRAAAWLLTVGLGLGSAGLGPGQTFSLVPSAAAQTAPASSEPPAATDSALAADLTHRDPTIRRRAPRDTFYLLEYVSAKTDKGVEGFEPGTEVHLVEVHRPTQTLVVTNGRAQVEVSPAQLTNDIDMAALVRQKDQANQAQIAAYMQAEQQTYNRFVREAAEATAKDIADRKEEQKERLAEAREAAEQARADRQANQSVNAAGGNNGNGNNGNAINSNGYYNDGGFGYGSPYAYFVSQTAAPAAAPNNPALAAPAAPASAPAASGPGNVALPAPAAPSGLRPK